MQMCEEIHAYAHLRTHRFQANRLHIEVNARPDHIDETGPAEPWVLAAVVRNRATTETILISYKEAAQEATNLRLVLETTTHKHNTTQSTHKLLNVEKRE